MERTKTMFRSSLLTLALVLGSLTAASAETACPPPDAAAHTKTPPVSVTAPGAVLDLRVADTVESQAYGLMCVRSLAPHTGMIFVFPGGDRQRSFWMKDTLIPLDMVFVRAGGRVSSVADNVPATTVTMPNEAIPTRLGVGTYVIELAAGEAAADGIVAGAALDVRRVGKAKY